MSAPQPIDTLVSDALAHSDGSVTVVPGPERGEFYLIRNDREPTMSRRDARAAALRDAADEQDDARDHDEYHAAADVVLHGTRSPYVDRWIEGLEEAEARRLAARAQRTSGAQNPREPQNTRSDS